jgi:hypothetical protein
MSETGGISPVDVTGRYSLDGPVGVFTVKAKLLDPASLGTVQLTCFAIENGVYASGTYYDEVVRAIKTQAVNLSAVGDSAVVELPFAVGPSWVPDNMHACAVLQQTTAPRTIHQAAWLDYVTDFTVSPENTVASVPQGNGTALFHATVRNASLSTDVFTLSVDQEAGWPTDLQVAGDPNWYTSLDVTLPAQTTQDVTIRVQTDAVKRIGVGDFMTTSANSGRTGTTPLTVYNGSFSVLLVDDDSGATYEAPYINALDALGYLYRDWDIAHQGNISPIFADMAGYDVIIWQTGYLSSNLLTPADMAALRAYLDAGGSLYLNSMDLLSTTVDATFRTDYLGVNTFTNNTRCHTASGVSGDPISDGLVLPLTYLGGEAGNRVDTINPTSTARTIFFSEISTSNALRNTAHGKVVFSTIPQNAISESDPAPDNSLTVMQRILTWLLPIDPAGVGEQEPAGLTRILGAQPNPFHPSTLLSFELSSAASASPVRLTLMDASGRLVRTLLDGRLAPGMHRMTWDGRDNSGRQTPSGVYFARLTSREGETSTKLVLTR